MEDEQQPVADDEFVLRRVHRVYYDQHLPIPIQPAAFRPTQRDTTGISVLRERFATPADTLANLPPDKRADYYVVRLPVRDLLTLGLSVVPEPIPGGPPGHAVIPELNRGAYARNKRGLKEIQLRLAMLAGSHIVHSAE